MKKDLNCTLIQISKKILGFDYSILKNVMQRSNVTPKVNRLNYIKIFLNIVDNKIEKNYLTKVFVQSSVGNLNLFRQDSIYKNKKYFKYTI